MAGDAHRNEAVLRCRGRQPLRLPHVLLQLRLQLISPACAWLLLQLRPL